MKMCQNMLPSVTKWYQNDLPRFQKVSPNHNVTVLNSRQRATKSYYIATKYYSEIHQSYQDENVSKHATKRDDVVPKLNCDWVISSTISLSDAADFDFLSP
jgi:hypothetical protein